MASSADDFGDDFDEVDYVEQRGPGIPELPAGPIVPDDLTPGDDVAGEVALEYPGWDEETIEQFLKGTGSGLHLLAGAGEKDWLMTRTDLDRIAPPLTRILNRYEPTLRASEYGDPILVTYGFGLYGWRSALQRQAAIRAKQRAGELGENFRDEDTIAGEDTPTNNGTGTSNDYVPYAQRRKQ